MGHGLLSVVLVLVLYLVAIGIGALEVGVLLTLTLAGDATISLWLTTHADRTGRRYVLLAGAGLIGRGVAPLAVAERMSSSTTRPMDAPRYDGPTPMSEAGLSPAIGLTIAFLLVLVNGFFVAAEFAIVKVRQTRHAELAAHGNATARLAQSIVGRLDTYLAATQLGITMASLRRAWAWASQSGTVPSRRTSCP